MHFSVRQSRPRVRSQLRAMPCRWPRLLSSGISCCANSRGHESWQPAMERSTCCPRARRASAARQRFPIRLSELRRVLAIQAWIALRPRPQRPIPACCRRDSAASAPRRGRCDGDDRWISSGLRQRTSWGRPLRRFTAQGTPSNPADQSRSRSCRNRSRDPATDAPVLALGGGSSCLSRCQRDA